MQVAHDTAVLRHCVAKPGTLSTMSGRLSTYPVKRLSTTSGNKQKLSTEIRKRLGAVTPLRRYINEIKRANVPSCHFDFSCTWRFPVVPFSRFVMRNFICDNLI